jgi:hypothetical protein
MFVKSLELFFSFTLTLLIFTSFSFGAFDTLSVNKDYLLSIGSNDSLEFRIQFDFNWTSGINKTEFGIDRFHFFSGSNGTLTVLATSKPLHSLRMKVLEYSDGRYIGSSSHQARDVLTNVPIPILSGLSSGGLIGNKLYSDYNIHLLEFELEGGKRAQIEIKIPSSVLPDAETLRMAYFEKPDCNYLAQRFSIITS